MVGDEVFEGVGVGGGRLDLMDEMAGLGFFFEDGGEFMEEGVEVLLFNADDTIGASVDHIAWVDGDIF